MERPSMQPGEFYLADFPFGDAPGMKLRPVVLLAGPIGPSAEVLVAYVSSVIPSTPLSTDILIDPVNPIHAGTGLKSRSVIRLHKLATIHSSRVRRFLGEASPELRAEINLFLKAFLQI
jgi:mRNA interferase MazF